MPHFKISISSIKPESNVPFNVFRKDNERFSLIVNSGNIFPKNLSKLIVQHRNAEPFLYILENDKDKYYNYLEEYLKDITSDNLVH